MREPLARSVDIYSSFNGGWNVLYKWNRLNYDICVHVCPVLLADDSVPVKDAVILFNVEHRLQNLLQQVARAWKKSVL
jgi:hypothetical protein